MTGRRAVDVEAYTRRAREGPCFVCTIVRGEAELPNPILYEDDAAIAWLNPFQVVLGYAIVAPKQHREEVTAEFSVDEYLALQRVVHRVGEAARRAVPTERLYVLSLGSKAGNAHVHWHLAPLPPGVLYADQQLAALDIERRGVLDLSVQELEELADRVRAQL